MPFLSLHISNNSWIYIYIVNYSINSLWLSLRTLRRFALPKGGWICLSQSKQIMLLYRRVIPHAEWMPPNLLREHAHLFQPCVNGKQKPSLIGKCRKKPLRRFRTLASSRFCSHNAMAAMKCRRPSIATLRRLWPRDAWAAPGSMALSLFITGNWRCSIRKLQKMYGEKIIAS